ncbi:hypothetical protein AYL99_01051 [Fonsecaea erecta]|uniref:Uncharacterized protein n=1 Tax=Fonsecaea erecta TaxID=1367422 RepID=A0A178ZZ43_9EURO|nr:hypothetical protein AYL99_01051 [Fonsecaea erecta]OAP65079.1 hypothetical protein AYL99_01051 [Fonsecaea erecta]
MAQDGGLILRLQYWHQSPVGESEQHNVAFHSLINDYLEACRRRAPLSYPWDCRQVPLTPGSGNPRCIVPVQVNLVHQHHRHASDVAASECRHLWNSLKSLTTLAEFRTFFGSPFICLNVYAVGVEDSWRHEYAFGIMVQNLRIETIPVHHIVENQLDFLRDSVLLTAEVVAILVRHALPMAGAQGAVQRSAQEELLRVIEIAQELHDIQIPSRGSQLNDERVLQEILQPITRARQVFQEAYGSAVSRLQTVCDSQNARPEDVMEAIVAVRKMSLLFPGADQASRDLTTTVKNKKSDTNRKVGAGAIGGGLVALYAAVYFFGGPVVAGCCIYTWVTGGTASSLALAGIIGAIGGSACAERIAVDCVQTQRHNETLKNARNDVHAALRKLQLLLAAYWLTNVWKIDLAQSPDREREAYLSSLGVDSQYFGQREYDLAQLRDLFDEFVLRHDTMRRCCDRLYRDLGVTVDVQAQEPVG